MLPIIALTGGIGCGKSIVAQLFVGHGAGLVDADAASRKLTAANGAALPIIADAFGENFIAADGALDRAKMRDLIFGSLGAKKKLEVILHPLIRAEMDAQIALLASNASVHYVIAEIPLLFAAADYATRYRRIAVVDCAIETQVARVQARSKLLNTEVRAIIAQQTPRQVRLQLADDVVSNGDRLSSLAPQILALHEKYLKLK